MSLWGGGDIFYMLKGGGWIFLCMQRGGLSKFSQITHPPTSIKWPLPWHSVQSVGIQSEGKL